MRIAHVIAACAALITAFHRAETVHSERRPESRDHLLQQNSENLTDVSEITFTTLRPEVTSFRQKALWNVYLTPRKPSKGRPNRSTLSGPRGPNYSKSARRRRQLHRLVRSSNHTSKVSSKPSAAMAKAAHDLGRSLDIRDNHIDHYQLESIQPVEAFEDGAIHIEPIYRVTKNKNVVDSLLGILKRLVNPPKSVGPLVGPFNFPGVGDKVYIRLLEPVESGHLVIRLVTHLPVSEIDATLDPSVLPVSDLISHAKVPSIGHASLDLADALTNSASSVPHTSFKSSLIPSDSLLSSSNNLVQMSKPPSTFGEGQFASESKKPFSKMYGMNFKNNQLASVQGITGHRTLNYRPLTATNDEHVDWSSFSKSTEQRNSSQDEYSSYQYPVDHPYQFHSTLNDSSNGSPLNYGVQESLNPLNISSFEPVVHGNPVFPLADPFPSIPSGYQVQGSPIGPPEDQPRYSLEFASKKMRYLNLDGSVETPAETVNNRGFRPMEQGPVLPKVTRSINLHWEPFKKMNSRPKEVSESSRKVEKDHRSGGEFLEAQRRSSGDCPKCPRKENEKREQQDQRSTNNSTSMTKEAKASTKSTLELLQLQRNSTKPRNV